MKLNAKAISIVAAAAGQLLLFASATVITRVYLPEQVGEYGVFFSLFSVLQIAVMLRLEQAIVYAVSDEAAYDLASVSGMILVPIMLVTLIPSYLYLRTNPATTAYAVYLLVSLELAVLSAGLMRLFVQLLVRHQRTTDLALINFLRPAFIAGSQFFAAFVGPGHGLMTGAFAAGQFAIMLVTIALFWTRCGRSARFSMQPPLWHTLRGNREFILFSLPQNILYVVGESIVPLSISFLFPDAHAVALYWLASRVVSAPSVVIVESIRPQIYRSIATRKDGLYRYALSVAALLSAPFLLGVITLPFIGPLFFGLVFGAQWSNASSYAMVLGVLLATNVASVPFIGALPILGLQRHYLIVESIGVLIRGVVLFMVAWQDPLAATAASTFGYVLVLLIFFGYVALRLSRRPAIP